MAELQIFEGFCETLYTSPDAAERRKAEEALVQLSTTPDYIPRCRQVLAESAKPYAQLVASNALKRLLVSHWNHLTPAEQGEQRSYALTYLATHGPTCAPYVAASLVSLVACVTKLGWADMADHQQVLVDVNQFLQATPAHLVLGLQLLHAIVTEMNAVSNTRSLSQHRKVAGAFRDECLFAIFQVSLDTLQKHGAPGTATAGTEPARVSVVCLQLSLACLGYDFIGTTLDEASEELGTIQVPSSWRATMEAPATMQLYFDVYSTCSNPPAKLALEVLVALGSIRRSLFSSDDERQGFLNRILNGTLAILQTQRGLTDHENYHELCRLLARLKANFQLAELVQCASYPEWISLVATLTVDSFTHWEWASNSVYYLLSLWSRLVASMPYLKGETPSHLESYVPQVITAFIQSRMELVTQLLQTEADIDDPLADDEQLHEQLDALPSLCRFQLQAVSTYVMSLFEPAAALYSQALSQPAHDRANNPQVAMRLAECEGKLSWLIYIIGQVLGSHLTPNANAETQQLVDGELTAAVLQLVPIIDAPEHAAERAAIPSNLHLHCAVLFFLQQFRKVYVGDQATASSKVYAKLQERLNLSDHLAVLAVLVNKVVANLRTRAECFALNERSLALFADLAGGYCSGKLLLKLDAVHYMLRHHTADHFPFLSHPRSARLRTTFYATLCKLLFLDEANLKFRAFMEPFTLLLRSLGQQQHDAAAFATPQVRTALLGLLRDLRGVASACSNRRTYGLLFDWLYPNFTPTLQRAMATFHDHPEITTPLLKLYCELVYNKAQRLTFDSSSPNGILLFRDASQLLCTYGTRVQELALPAGADLYARKYKGISLCMLLLTRALSGNYVNFGVFALYGDRALADCLAVTIQMCLHTPLDEILAYPKVAKAYFTLMELLLRSHTATIVDLDTQILKHLCHSLTEGLKSHEVAISSQCAAALEHLAAYRFRELADADDADAYEVAARPPSKLANAHNLFASQLNVLLHMIVFEECTNQWSLSRPLLALIIIGEAAYAAWVKQALHALAPHPQRQAKLASAFEKLMADIPRGQQANLDVKVRDRFTQNLSQFRHEVRTLV